MKTFRLSLLLMALGGCGGGGGEDDREGVQVAASEADLAADAALANEAAADEAADMTDFGGNAAAMDSNAR